MTRARIYIAHPVSGLGHEEVVGYYENIAWRLGLEGYDVLNPMTAHGYDNPVSTNHAIKERDQWMIGQSDVVLVDFTGSKAVSIGCCMELAWADLLRKHTIVAMNTANIHQHAFVLECADIVFPDLDDAMDYLGKLSKGEIG